MKKLLLVVVAAGCTQRSSPCGVMQAGDSLMPEETLGSCDGVSELKMQADGNLVLYLGAEIPAKALWATGTNGWDGYRADMQADGNFVLYDSFGQQPSNALWSSGTWGLDGAQLELSDGGALAVTYGGTVVWAYTRGDRNAAGY